MHILATFATLCCQTRWPRNHSCTTQEHVSFFSGHFRTFSEISTFSTFWHFLRKTRKSVQIHENTFSQMRAHSQNRIHKLAQVQKHFAHVRNFLQTRKTQMCKCANVQKPSVHKMRKSAAQIIFQMQKSQICTVHKNTNANFCTCHNFWNAEFTNAQLFFSSVHKLILQFTNNL